MDIDFAPTGLWAGNAKKQRARNKDIGYRSVIRCKRDVRTPNNQCVISLERLIGIDAIVSMRKIA